MFVLDVLFDHIQQIASNVEIIGRLVQFAQFRRLMSELGPGCVKRARAKDAQNCFLNCLLPTEAASATGFYIDEIEIEILRAGLAWEFSHSLGQKLT
jgi:hypothetical protein